MRATSYLKMAMCSQLRDMGGFDDGELQTIKEAWERDLVAINAMLARKDIKIEMPGEEEEDYDTYRITVGDKVSNKSNRENAVSHLLDSL